MRGYILSLCLLFTISLCTWQLQGFFHHAPSVPVSMNSPNAIVENVSAVRYGENGILQSRLIAPKIIHYPKDDTAEVFSPKIILYNPSEPAWTVTANFAKTIHGLETIVLSGDVKLYQPAGAHNPEMTITTNSLTLHPKEETAATNQPITFMAKGNDHTTTIVKSLGVRAYQKTGIVELLSQTRGYYDPGK